MVSERGHNLAEWSPLKVVICVPNGISVGLTHITFTTYIYLRNKSQASIEITPKLKT